ncbi:BEN domain-containing protein [Camponotus japonicus]
MQTPSRATEIRTVPNDNMDNASESTSKCLENKENNSYCESKYSTAKVAVMQKEIKSLKKKVAELEEENNELSSNLKHYRLKLHEKDKYIKTLSDLNMDLQQTVIEKSKEYNDRVEEFLNAKNSISTGDNYPKIGILRTTDGINRIHLGKNIFVPEKSYSAFLTNSKTPSQCAGNLLILVFDIEELMTGTRTGFTSNASAVGKKTCSKLDEIKYSVCADFYCYWMETIYKPDKKQVEQFDIDLLKFNTYAAKKIADLKRDPEKKKKKKSSKRSAGSVSETDSVQGSSLDNITNKNNGDNDKGPSSDVLSKDKDRNIENQNISEEIANQKYTVSRYR